MTAIRKSLTPLALAVAMATLPGMASAAGETGENYDNYVYFGGFYLAPDKDRGGTNNNYGYSAGAGHRLSNNLWLEGQYFGSTIETGNNAGTDFYQKGASLDVAYAFGQRSEFTPYLIAGLGGVHNDVASSALDKTTFFGNVGAGFTKAILGFDNLRVRGEARAIYDDYRGGKLDFRAGLGLEMGLGVYKKPEPEIREKLVEVPIEKVVIKEVPVERVVIKEVPAPAPEPVPVQVDDDGDGVINERDRCPNTLKGARVDGNGCVVEQTLTIRDITFEFNSARLTANAQRLMENVVAFLRADSSIRISISGHTDNKGSDAYNLKLSRDRANEVRDYLIGYGIDGSRLDAAGYGESRPVATNDTDEGREFNRRVEFRIEK